MQAEKQIAAEIEELKNTYEDDLKEQEASYDEILKEHDHQVIFIKTIDEALT